MKIKFPFRDREWVSDDGTIQYHRYYHIHIECVLNLFKRVNADIALVDPRTFPIRSHVVFDCYIDNKLIRFDFSDFEKLKEEDILGCDLYFKFHYKDSHKKYPNVFPFTPVNFHNWEEFYQLRTSILYRAKGKVLNNQTPYGAAVERRTYVQELLKERYGERLSCDRKTQREFFELINEGVVSVCVPGARNDMLDRGQCQYMAFGCCTISPKLKTRLSWDKELVPNFHYVECKEDYSDLIEKVEWVINNPSKAIDIGENAKSLFKETSEPRKQVLWIKDCLKKISQ
jgi:hypothetical protein